MSFLQSWLDFLFWGVGGQGYTDTDYLETQPSECIPALPKMSVKVVEYEISDQELRANLGIPQGRGVYVLSCEEVNRFIKRDRKIFRRYLLSNKNGSVQPQEPFTFIDEDFVQRRGGHGSVCYLWKNIKVGGLLKQELHVLHASVSKRETEFRFDTTIRLVQDKGLPLIWQRGTRVLFWVIE